MHELRSENIRVRLTSKERRYIELDMEKNGERNMSEYIRKKILTDQAYVSYKQQREIERLCYEIHKIGVNINQIAKRYNAGAPFYTDPKLLLEKLDEIRQLTGEIKNIGQHAKGDTYAVKEK